MVLEVPGVQKSLKNQSKNDAKTSVEQVMQQTWKCIEMEPKRQPKSAKHLEKAGKKASENRCENLILKSGAAGRWMDQLWLPRGSIFGPAGGVGGGRYLITPDILEDF